MSNTLLVNAIRDSNFAVYQELVASLSIDKLDSPNTIHYSDWFPGIGFSLLQLTSMVRPTYAKPLIDKGVKIDLHSACALGDFQIIESLLKEDPSLINNCIAGFYPIQFSTKNQEALNLLLEHGEDPNKDITHLAWFDWETKAAEKGIGNYKPIHLIAVGRGSVATAECLHKFGADLSATSSPFGEASIHLAAIYNKALLIEWLVEHGIDVDTVTGQRHADLKLGELFNETHFSPFEESYRKTALMLAAGEGQIAAVRELIKLKANPNAQDTEGYTPLHYAAGAFWNSNIEIIKLLINSGAVIKSKSHSGLTPRDLAVKKNYTSSAELLS